MTPLRPKAWQRPRYRASGYTAACLFFCFWEDAGVEAEGDAFAEFSPYAGEPDYSVRLDQYRSTDADAAHAFAKKVSLEPLDPALQAKILAGPRSEHIEVTADDPPELGYLQTAWGAVVQAVREGAIAVKDVTAGRWWLADEVLRLDPHRRFSARAEIAVSVERADDGYVQCETQGMEKLGLPELGLRIPEGERSLEWARYWIERAIEQGAEGETFQVDAEVFVEGRWLRVLGAVEREGLPPLHVLTLADRPLHEASPLCGHVPPWARDLALTPFGVSDAELRYLLPNADLRVGTATWSANGSPGAIWADVSARLPSDHRIVMTQEPRQDVLLVQIEHRGAGYSALSCIVAKGEAMPPRPELAPLRQRLAGGSLVLFAFLA